MVINRFRDEYDFLSNFGPYPVTIDGVMAPTAEHWYQAYKSLDPIVRDQILSKPSPGSAKSAGRKALLRPDWEAKKIPIMRFILQKKFRHDSVMADLLVRTGHTMLIEGNYWGDTFWGVSENKGDNWLGHLLMARRAELRAYKG